MQGPDLSVFQRQKTIVDQQQLQDAFELKKALAAAELQKALAPEPFNIDKVGQEAFVKAANGMALSPTEQASLQYLDSKQQTLSFNPVTGAMEQKPSLLQRAGIGKQPQATRAVLPNQQSNFAKAMRGAPSVGTGDPIADMAPIAYPDTASGKLDDFIRNNPMPSTAPEMDAVGKATQLNDFVSANPLPLTPAQRRQQKQQQELAAAGNNPKLQQTIKEKYVNAESPTVKFDQENKLRDEFTAMTKPFRELQDAYSKVQNISDTAAGDIALLYATAKLNDPTSVVRESEFAIQAAAGNLGDRMKNLVQKVTTGNRLTPDQRAQLKSETNNLYKAQLQGYDQLKEQFKGIAYENELNPKNIIADYATPNMPKTPAEAKAQFNTKKQAGSVKEGATATNPATGQKITFRNGQWQ